MSGNGKPPSSHYVVTSCYRSLFDRCSIGVRSEYDSTARQSIPDQYWINSGTKAEPVLMLGGWTEGHERKSGGTQKEDRWGIKGWAWEQKRVRGGTEYCRRRHIRARCGEGAEVNGTISLQQKGDASHGKKALSRHGRSANNILRGFL